MCRALINFFLGVLTVALLVVTIVLSVFYFNLTNTDFHKQNILDSGFYNFAANRVEQYVNSSALPSGVGGQAAEDLLDGVPELILRELSAEKLQIIAENNINNLNSFFNGQSASMVVYLPVSRVRDLVPDVYEQLRMNLNEIVAERPVCAEGEKPDENFSCVPAEAKEQGGEQLLPPEFASEEKVMEAFTTYFPLITSEEDNFTVQQLAASFNFPQKDTDTLVSNIARARDMYDTSRVIVICVWAINVALLLLFVLTLPKGFRAKVSKISFWVLLVGLGVFLSGIASAVLSTWMVNNVFVQGGPSEYLVGLDTVLRAFMNITLSRLYQQLIIGGAIVLFVGVMFFMLIVLTRRRASKVEAVQNQPSPITV